MNGFLLPAFIYLAAAVIAVPLAKRFGLGSVLGYLIAGVIIGPISGLVGSETEALQHFAEFGVVMMLFLVGLELEPRALWEMRNRLPGLGGLQVLLTTVLVAAAVIALGQPWELALAIGLVLSLSSTAIVLQTFNEKGLMKSEGGQASFSVLLFQDMAVIPMLALLPLLALPELSELVVVQESGQLVAPGDDHHDAAGEQAMAGLPCWQVALLNLGAIALVVIGICVVLANSEYRHELGSDIEPFKGLLLGLFFITVGAGIDFGTLFGAFLPIVGLTLALIAIKALVLTVLAFAYGVGRGIDSRDRWLFMLAVAQAGEFGFVLISFCLSNDVIPQAIADILLLVVALSMLLTPVLVILLEKVIVPRLSTAEVRADEEITEQGTAIIAGHGRFGQVINRILASNGFKTVVLDTEADLIEDLRRFDIEVFYGDASRPDLLASAGLAEARLLVVAIDDRELAVKLIAHARRERPDLHIVARAFDRRHVYDLYKSGTSDIVRETFDSAVRARRYSLQALGMHPFDAENATRDYV